MKNALLSWDELKVKKELLEKETKKTSKEMSLAGRQERYVRIANELSKSYNSLCTKGEPYFVNAVPVQMISKTTAPKWEMVNYYSPSFQLGHVLVNEDKLAPVVISLLKDEYLKNPAQAGYVEGSENPLIYIQHANHTLTRPALENLQFGSLEGQKELLLFLVDEINGVIQNLVDKRLEL